MKYRVYFYVDLGGEDGPISSWEEFSDLQKAIEFSENIPNLEKDCWCKFHEIIKFEKIDYTPESLKKLLEEEREQDMANKLKRASAEEKEKIREETKYSKPIDGFF